MDDQHRWYKHVTSDPNQLVLIAEYNGCVMRDDDYGGMGVALYSDIDWVSRTLKISGSIYKKHRKDHKAKAGFAAGLDFAFEMLNMQKVEAEVLEYNVPAQKLEIDYLGFKVEGRRRRAVYKCGQYYDSLLLGMLREEWASDKRVMSYEGTCNKNFDHELAEWMISRGKREASGSQSPPSSATPAGQA